MNEVWIEYIATRLESAQVIIYLSGFVLITVGVGLLIELLTMGITSRRKLALFIVLSVLGVLAMVSSPLLPNEKEFRQTMTSLQGKEGPK